MAQRAEPEPTEIAGRYQVVKKLGAGAFGTVFKAKDKILGRMLAIKTIRMEGLAAAGASVEELLDRFKREAQVSAQLKHPNIVTIYDIGEAEGTTYLAMEFIDGVGLDRVIAATGRLGIERTASIGAQLADALDFAHRGKVVHRDIKPANIMIEAGDRVKVTDFGIAKLTDSAEHLTMTGSLLGTPSYMSPEQARGSPLDGRSDLFAVGCILYEMLTGQKAFRGDSITGLIFKIITEEPTAVHDLDPSVPEEMVAIIQKALSKAPEYRYQTGRELAEDLLALTRGEAPTLREGELDTARSVPGSPTLRGAPTMAGSPPTISGQPTAAGPAPTVLGGAVSGVRAPAPPAQATTLMPPGQAAPAAAAAPRAAAPTYLVPPSGPPPTQPTVLSSGRTAAPLAPAPVAAPAVPAPSPAIARAKPQSSKAGLIIGLVAAGIFVVLGLGVGGVYFFVIKPKADKVASDLSTLVPSTTPGAPADSVPATPETTTPSVETTPTTLPESTATTTPAATTPPVTMASNTTNPVRTTPAATLPPATTSQGGIGVLDRQPPQLDGRDQGAAVADTYRSPNGQGSGNFGTNRRFRQREKFPSDVTGVERKAVYNLLNMMNLQGAYKARSGHYGSFKEILPAAPASGNVLEHNGYRFQLTVGGEDYKIVATPLGNGRALIADDNGYVRWADE